MSQGDVSPDASKVEPEDRLSRGLARLLQIALGCGLVVVVAGSVLELVRRGHLGRSAVPIAKLGSGLAAFDASAVLTLGLVILLAAPAAGLAYLVVVLLARRDRGHALIAAVVLAILIGSMFVKGAL